MIAWMGLALLVGWAVTLFYFGLFCLARDAVLPGLASLAATALLFYPLSALICVVRDGCSL